MNWKTPLGTALFPDLALGPLLPSESHRHDVSPYTILPALFESMTPPHLLHHAAHQTSKAMMESSRSSSLPQQGPTIACILISLLPHVIDGHNIGHGVILLSCNESESLAHSNIHQLPHENDGGPSSKPRDCSAVLRVNVHPRSSRPLGQNNRHHQSTNTRHTLWPLSQNPAIEKVHHHAHALLLFVLTSFVLLVTN